VSEGRVGPGATARTRLRRLPSKAVTDRAVLHAILDAGLVAHVGVVGKEGQPFVVAVGYARADDRVLFHGSTASRLFRALAGGAPACLTVTLLDGLVLARSAFESSMNYRSVMVLGRCEVLEDEAKLAALKAISDALMPGRWSDLRPPTPKELRATRVLALPLRECSVKVSAGPPEDPDADLDWPTWAGVVPLHHHWGEPIPAPDLRFAGPPPAYVTKWQEGRS
jgi:nitroimidazol reductase NimA-like FMN-containing flavoprotein (pyridoxamine 5'-phosphate oxidase superfamily)